MRSTHVEQTTDLAATWEAYLQALGQAGKDVVWDNRRVVTDVDRGEGLRYLLGIAHAGYVMEMANTDPAYPIFGLAAATFYPWGFPNPDCRYDCAPVHGDYTYRVYGRRGTATVVNAEIYQGRMDEMTGFSVLANVDIEPGEPGEEFELFLSQEPREGNWLQLPPGPGMVWLRQYYGDWENEDVASIFIEREGAVYPPPPNTAQVLNQRLASVARITQNLPRLFVGAANKHYEAPTDRIEFPPLDWGMDDREGEQVGFAALNYGQARYELAPDECAIIEVEPPECPYWQIQLLNAVWMAPNFQYWQISLNNTQAFLDADGIFRAVIAHDDPGIPNWLDTEHREIGLIGARYYRAESVPEPTIRVVPLAELRRYLPTEHPTVTPSERSATLHRRLLAVQRRVRG